VVPVPAPRSTLAQRQQAALDEGGVPAYRMSVGFWLDGVLDRDALRDAVQGLLARHEALRTTLAADGVTLVVHPAADATPGEVLTEHVCPDDDDLDRFRQSWAEQPIGLAAGPVFRVALVQTAPQRHLLLIAGAHAAVDGWSFGVLVDDLVALYNAGCQDARPLLPPAAQFRDYTAWHERVAAGPDAAEHRDYWRTLLQGAEAPKLPGAGTSAPFPYRAERHSVRLDAEFCDRMRETAREQGVTVFAYLVAAWGAVLHEVTGQDDLVVPVLAARRPPELDRMAGYCSNLLPLRLRRTADVLAADYVADVMEHLVTGLETQDHPFADLIEELAPGDGLRAGLLATSISFYRRVAAPPMDGLTVSDADPLPITHTGHPLALNIVEGADGLRCDFEIATDVVAPELAATIAGRYRTLLDGLLIDGDRP
jgi:hypothetical protein